MWTCERRLAFWGARLLNIILAVSLLAGILLLLLMGFLTARHASGADLGGASMTLWLPAELTIARSAYEISAGSEFQLAAGQIGITMPLATTPKAVRLLFPLVVLTWYAFYIYVIYSLQKMFAGFADGQPFQGASVRAIRLVAWVLVIDFANEQFSHLLSLWVFRRVEVTGEVSVTQPPLLATSALLSLAAGVTLFFIARAFGRAALIEAERDILQKEQNLTI